MTNKVKPFYIRITEDMTPQMVQDAFDKCVDVGAFAHDGIKNTSMKHKYNDLYSLSFEYIGVDYGNNTYTTVDAGAYGDTAQEITLDQLDDWLGLESKVEWDGEYKLQGQREWFKYKSTYIASNGDMFALCLVPSANDGKPFEQYLNSETTQFRKPETPEQKAEREKKEEAAEMIQCLLDNYTECDDSAIEYVINYLKECESLGR